MNSLRTRLGLLLTFFFLLITISVGIMVWGLQAQAQDALVINLAGRQRMLVQQMTRLAIEIHERPEAQKELQAVSQAFQETLDALQSGGQVQYPTQAWSPLPPARSSEIQKQLQGVAEIWATYKSQMEALLSLSTSGETHSQALFQLETTSTALVAAADQAVLLYQEASGERVGRLGALQAGFFFTALGLLGAGIALVQRQILAPITRLNQAAERIRNGDLQTPVQKEGLEEIRILTRSFEAMRAGLQASHQELARWNQTLEEKVKERTQELDALYTVSREISARLEKDAVLTSVTQKAGELLQAEVASLCLLDLPSGSVRLQAIAGPPETVQRLSAPADNAFVQAILSQPGGLHCAALGCHSSCGIIADGYKRSHLAAPLIAEHRIMGALCVADRQEGKFSKEDPALLTRLASAAAVAIENARLYEQAERIATLEERQRIAADMHDGLAQMLYAQGMLLDQLEDQLESGNLEPATYTLAKVRTHLSQASNEVRQGIANLQQEPSRPKALDQQLQALVQQCALDAPEIDWQVDIHTNQTLPPEDTRQVLGIVQEAIANARRHAGASQITIDLSKNVGQGVLTVEDNGRGFDPSAPLDNGRQHFGLKILHARAAMIGGQVYLESAPGHGTRVRLTWPVRQSSPLYALEQKEER